jgi:hypothetical protein
MHTRQERIELASLQLGQRQIRTIIGALLG